MQIDRLFSITYYLLNHRSTTAKELSNQFEVSVRTILRDIEILSSAGIPIYTSQGTGGGIFLDKDYVLNRAALTDEEQQRIMLALKSISAAGQIETAALAEKLGSLFSKTYTDFIEIDFSQWGKSHMDKPKFEQLMSAIISCQKVSFSYVNMNLKKSSRLVCPIKLKFQSKAWYLQAFSEDKNTYRTFKINRISDLCVQHEDFDKSKLPNPSTLKGEGPSSDLIHLELRFSSCVAHRLYDDFDADDIIVESNGTCGIKIYIPETDWVYGYILSFGSDVEVISPDHIKKRICETALDILKKYSHPI